MSTRDATDEVLAVLDREGVRAYTNDVQYEALADAICRAIAQHTDATIAAKDAEIARLREALRLLLNACDYSTTARMYVAAESSVIAARAALSQESGR